MTTDDADLGFDSGCTDRQEDVAVSAESTSHTASLTLHGCATPGGTVTATLLSGGATIDTATQDVTVPNTAATGVPTISGTVQSGETLTADTSGIADADGLDNVTYGYQWLADDADIVGATDSTYTLTDDEVGRVIEVRVSFNDDAGNEEALTSAATAVVEARPNRAATGAPTVSGTAQVGETLTAKTSGIADADGLDNVSYGYQWMSDDGNGDVNIAGATGSTYTLVDADEGKAIRVKVSFSDDRNHQKERSSDATGAVGSASPLTASFENAPTTHDGQNTFTFELRFSEEASVGFRRLRDHTFSVTGGTVTRARRLERGSSLPWEITVQPDSGSDVTIVLPATTDCTARGAICTTGGKKLSERMEITVQNTAATGAPVISGAARVEEALTADTSGISDADGLANVTYSYQWTADGVDITGATDSTYTLTASDEGKVIRVRVSFTDDADNEETLTSAATAAVAAAGPVWSAEMSVVDYGTGSIGASSADLFSNEGGSAGLQVRWLWYHTPSRELRCQGRREIRPRGVDAYPASPVHYLSALYRRAESDGQWRKRYGLRAGIEGTNSELKRRHGLGRFRVRGGERVQLAVYLKALACNVKRMVLARLDEMLFPPAALATAPPHCMKLQEPLRAR